MVSSDEYLLIEQYYLKYILDHLSYKQDDTNKMLAGIKHVFTDLRNKDKDFKSEMEKRK